VLRALEEIFGRGAFQHLSLVHEQDAVGHLAGETHFVRDAHHGHAVTGEVLHDQQHLVHHLRVQRGGGLVEQHDRRLHGQGARDGHALLLAARQLAGVGAGLVRQAHAFKQAHRKVLGFLRQHALELHWCERAVLQDGQVREQVELLEDEADAAAQLVHVDAVRVHVLPIDGDAAFLNGFEPVQRADER